jgi:tetratricopeptide (TPR) repeat protein
VILATASTAPLKADHESRTAQRMANADEFIDDVMAHHERSFDYNPIVPQYRAITAAYLEQQAGKETDRGSKQELLERSVALYRKAGELQPGHHGWKMALGKATAQLAAVGRGGFTDALALLDEAQRLSPYDWRVLANRGDVYNLWATTAKEPDYLCRSLESYEDATELRPRAGDAWTGVGRTLARLGHLDEAIEALEKADRFDNRTELPAQLIEEVEKLQARKDPPRVERC